MTVPGGQEQNVVLSAEDIQAAIKDAVGHIARGCRSAKSHDPILYEIAIDAALSRLSGRVTELEQRADYYALALRAIDGLPDSQGESMRAIARATLAAAVLAGSAGQEQA